MMNKNKALAKERAKILRNRIKELRYDTCSAALTEIRDIQAQLVQGVDWGVEYGDYLKEYDSNQ